MRIEVDLGAAVGHWRPGIRRDRVLPADQSGRQITSLVHSGPGGVLYDAAGTSLLGWAVAEAIVELTVLSGVSEERKTFVVEVRLVRPPACSSCWTECGRTWPRRSDACQGGSPGTRRRPVVPSPFSRAPASSTWYKTGELSMNYTRPRAANDIRRRCCRYRSNTALFMAALPGIVA